MPLNRFLLVIGGAVTFRGHTTAATVPCSGILDCEHKVRKGSECVDGFCTNPYHFEGCLASHNVEHYKIRTCSSDDPQSSIEKGLCRPSSMGYNEVRISSQNWESAIFITWILQILLSEVLDVPVTVETSSPEKSLDFYDINSSFDFGGGNDWDALRRSKEVKDCRKLQKSEEYTACSHIIPEVWYTLWRPAISQLQDELVIETPDGVGVLGEQLWFVPRRTGKRYPAFLSYLGLQGAENRKLLAEVFKRPTTWSDYCKHVSADNCQTPDKHSFRPPTNEEGGVYYVSNAYDGYFSATDENNCVKYPDNCTGHIVDYPCGWASVVVQQAHYLDIGVASSGKEPGSNGYSYGEMVQIWNAANATNSDVLILWWRPEALYQQFLGTDSEFLGVTLPPPTQLCENNRVDSTERCLDDPALRLGDPRGSCEEAPQHLKKIISKALHEISFDPETPKALHSPAYETVQDFRISELQIGEIFQKWFNQSVDRSGLDARHATCEWVRENLQALKKFLPRSHPRVIVESDDVYRNPSFHVATVLACVAIASILVASVVVFFQREKTAIRYAQIQFLFLLLVGLLLVSVGSLMTALSPTHVICATIVWLVNFGYTLELVPLIAKIAAINRLMVASQQMRRVELKMVSLFGGVVFFCILVCACLAIWTAVDPPRKYEEIELTDEKSTYGETKVKRSYYCSSDSNIWTFIGVSWHALLLLGASILAFQTRKVREDLNETKVLAMMIYSQMVLVILRAITYVLDSFDHAGIAVARSMILSVDVLATVVIYFVPKLLEKENSGDIGVPMPLSTHVWKAKIQSTSEETSSGKKITVWAKPEPVNPVSSLPMESSNKTPSGHNSRSRWDSCESGLGVTEEKTEDSGPSNLENSVQKC